MEFIIFVALMVVLYLVPELLRRRKPKEYQYPDIPAPSQPPEPAPAEQPGKFADHTDHTAVFSAAHEAQTDQPYQSQNRPETAAIAGIGHAFQSSPWQGRMDRTAIVSGFVFAEIVGPPRARQIMYKKRRF